ncbi:hypothetical protein Sste5346_003315 [Sporothrix stenoceras]|uniref:Xylanolytic transcriptional activator regulatory domain-containing protein n=1 Tax=Sporothrix stenoceras TaxID=5173 RepID=A0ABR3ZFF4_9PEZI
MSDDHNNNANDKDDNTDDNEGGRGWHEFRLYNHHDNNDDQEVCDDVNGLSINIHRRSYLGIGSIQAIFRAMFRVKPSLQWELQRAISLRSNANMRNMRATEAVPVAPSVTTGSPSSISTSAGTAHAAPPAPPLEEETAINAYFAHIHGIVPLLDEVHFRDLWRRGQRCDRPWLALLNMVLVLGSLAFGDERSSHIYYLRAQTYLDFELLATGCLESLQALCLLGGLYLHLRNAPNMAYTVMGMAYRIAIGLGLHRMPGLSAGGGKDKDSNGSGGPWRPQIRQRIWWSLFCLDTWGSMNLGRPTLGRWDPRAMTVPRLVSGMQTDTSDTLNTPDPLDLSLDCASAFCLVATKIQQRLAQPAPMRTDEVLLFDAQVQSWHRSLPPVLLHADQCPTPLRSAQRILRYRYFNLRMLLLRSVLIRYAHGRAGSANGPGASPASLSQPDQQAVSLCRDIACEAVEQIHLSVASSSEEGDAANRILVWSAVWYLYQATMVLLLSIMVDPDHPESLRWRASVETALVLLGSATPVSRAADRSRLLVQSLLHICGGNSAAVTNVAGNAETADETMESVTATAPIFTFPAYPALSPSNTMSTMGNHQPGAHPGAHPGSLSGMNAMTGIPGNMSDEDLWSLLGLDMFTEETSTWGVNELGDWPVTDYNHGQFGA